MRAALFPGFVATLLAGVALVTGHAWRDRGQRLWLAVGLAGLLLSFGTRTPGYVWLYYLVPLLQGIRAPVRFGYLVLVRRRRSRGIRSRLAQSARMAVERPPANGRRRGSSACW
jgi:hypothetical protein